ncbi:hypothetical protein B0O80DRAFT_462853 [Mortierella sp. GBAus27b]|nr:hypothetical protein B0O80DRAFT_462853 [Mortierella sp. GBAus27b]
MTLAMFLFPSLFITCCHCTYIFLFLFLFRPHEKVFGVSVISIDWIAHQIHIGFTAHPDSQHTYSKLSLAFTLTRAMTRRLL